MLSCERGASRIIINLYLRHHRRWQPAHHLFHLFIAYVFLLRIWRVVGDFRRPIYGGIVEDFLSLVA